MSYVFNLIDKATDSLQEENAKLKHEIRNTQQAVHLLSQLNKSFKKREEKMKMDYAQLQADYELLLDHMIHMQEAYGEIVEDVIREINDLEDVADEEFIAA